MLLYLAGLDAEAPERAARSAHGTPSERLTPREESPSATSQSGPGWGDLLSIFQDDTAKQVRIRRSIRIRVTPRRGRVTPSSLLEALPSASPSARLAERKAGTCLPAADIMAVQAGRANRLMLFMRDRRIFTAYLEKACLAREFYSGFYLERNADGKFCIDRDRLQSRAGVNCQVGRIGQLVAVRD